MVGPAANEDLTPVSQVCRSRQAHQIAAQVVHYGVVLQQLRHVSPARSVFKLKHDTAAVRTVAVGIRSDDARVAAGGDRTLAGDPGNPVDDVYVVQEQQIAAERDLVSTQSEQLREQQTQLQNDQAALQARSEELEQQQANIERQRAELNQLRDELDNERKDLEFQND